ncbi:hypothetical protein FRC00_014562, partial [Tulasnella sp. 408]
MRFTSALVLLSGPLLALSKVSIYTSYSSGTLWVTIYTYTGAPSSVDIVAIDSSGNQYDLATGVDTTGSGRVRIFLPASTRPGSHRVLVVDPATGETLFTSESFYVCEGDLAVASSLSLQTVSFTQAITGSIIPYVSTPEPSDISKPLTVPTTSVVTGSSGTPPVPVTQTITGSVLSSSRAAIATLLTVSTTTQGAGFGSEPQLHLALPTASTTTTRSAGFKNT